MSLPLPASSDGSDSMADDPARIATTRECRDNFFAVLREVHETGIPVVLTKRGKPYVRIVREAEIPGDMFGCDKDILQIVGDIDEPIWPDDDFDMIARPHQVLG
jgi:prevent-host-death family protein